MFPYLDCGGGCKDLYNYRNSLKFTFEVSVWQCKKYFTSIKLFINKEHKLYIIL